MSRSYGRHSTKIKSEVTDSLPDCKEKKEMVLFLEAYTKRLLKCNACICILEELSTERAHNSKILGYAPAFWGITVNSLWMMLVTNINSFFALKDSASIYNFFSFMDKNMEKLFTREFLDDWEYETERLRERNGIPRN